MSATAPAESPTPAPQRMVSVDALRGFDMFWITGGEGAVKGVAALCGGWVATVVNGQLDHSPWEGFTFYDLIFPLFAFLIGVSITFSLGRLKESGGRAAVYKRLFKRTIVLLLLGVLYYGGARNHWPEGVRLLGVLQRLALVYFFAGLAYYHLELRGMIILCVALLLGYCAFLSFVPVPGLGATSFEEGKNWATYVDLHFLPGRLYYKEAQYDPEGLLSTIPAVCTGLLGVFSGLLLTAKSIGDKKKVLYLIGGGAALVIVGFLWGLQFPVIKKIWTSSYVLVAGGYSAMMLGVFYQVIDVWKFRKWTIPFLWVGMNPLTIYLAHNFFDFDKFAERFAGGDIHAALGETAGGALLGVVALAISMLFARFLYKNKIFIRL